MKKDVLVAITGMQVEYSDEEMEEREDEPIEIISPATYFLKDGLHYVFYEEVQEGSTNVVQNKIVFRENESLEVIKKGATNSNMLFSVTEQHYTNYETPYGEMILGVTTNDLRSNIEEERITIEASYELSVNGDLYANCQITMKICDKELGMAL